MSIKNTSYYCKIWILNIFKSVELYVISYNIDCNSINVIHFCSTMITNYNNIIICIR